MRGSHHVEAITACEPRLTVRLRLLLTRDSLNLYSLLALTGATPPLVMQCKMFQSQVPRNLCFTPAASSATPPSLSSKLLGSFWLHGKFLCMAELAQRELFFLMPLPPGLRPVGSRPGRAPPSIDAMGQP